MKVVELDPGKGGPLREVGYCYFKLNDIPKAEKFLRKAVELSLEDPSASFRLADVYWGQGKLEKARPFLIRTLDLIVDEERDQGEIIHVGEYKIAAIQLGGLYRDQRLFEKSLQCFDRVIALDPGVALAYQGRAINYAEMGQWERVMEQIEALRKLKADKVLEALKATLQSIRARSVTPLPEGAVFE